MALMRSLNAGVSGLRAFQTKMDTIGNNIANVDTVGFKSSRVSFSELMNQNIGGTGGGESAPSLSNQVGLGVRVASITRDFSQGTIENTGVTTDLAIQGEGFFVVNDGSQNLMTRAGNFTFNKDGFLVDQAGRFVQGYNANGAGNIIGGGTTDNISVDFENTLAPKQTEQVNLAGNLNANTSTEQVVTAQSAFTDSTTGDVATAGTLMSDLNQITTLTGGETITFQVTPNTGGASVPVNYVYDGTETLGDMVDDLNTELTTAGVNGQLRLVDGLLVFKSTDLGDSQLEITNVTSSAGAGSIDFPEFQITQEGETNTEIMSTTVYDDLGEAHSLLLNFTQIAENTWEYTVEFADGENINSVVGTGTGVGPTPTPQTVTFDELGQVSDGGSFTIDFDPGNGATNATFEVELGDAGQGIDFTQYAGANTAKVISQDGYTQGSLIDITINGDGLVQGIYSNGRNRDLAQLALGDVQNPAGLKMVGGGLYRPTSAAGQVFIDTAASMADTSINSGALEGSNVELAQQFTEMITAQRAYQSSARVITTSDDMLSEAVNLKR